MFYTSTFSFQASLDHERLQPISKNMQSSLGQESIEGNLATIPGLSRALIQRAARSGNMPTAIKIEELLRRNEVGSNSASRTLLVVALLCLRLLK